MKANGFAFEARAGAGSPMGGRWQRALASDKVDEVTGKMLKQQYDELQGRAVKQNFRARWAEGMYNKFTETKTYQEGRTLERRQAGTWYSLKRIAVEDGGGGTEGLRAAYHYSVSCLRKGPRWYEYN